MVESGPRLTHSLGDTAWWLRASEICLVVCEETESENFTHAGSHAFRLS